MRSLYVRPGLCPITWADRRRSGPARCSPSRRVPGQQRLSPDRRANAEAVLVDLLEPVPMSTIEVRSPADDRAADVASASGAAADGKTLAEWGHEVGASERTLAREFLAGTGMTFGALAHAAAAAGRAAGPGRRPAGRRSGAAGRLRVR